MSDPVPIHVSAVMDKFLRGLEISDDADRKTLRDAISARGAAKDTNDDSGEDAFVGGGDSNVVSGKWAGVLAGVGCQAAAQNSVVGGGQSNAVATAAVNGGVLGGAGNQVSGVYGAIGGGQNNAVEGESGFAGGGSGARATGKQSGVLAGLNCQALGERAVVGGGNGNTATEQDAGVLSGSNNHSLATTSVVCGGSGNQANAGAVGGGILCGTGNVVEGSNSAVVGGSSNAASYGDSGVFCGTNNKVLASTALVLGGTGNTVEQSSSGSVILGGNANSLTAPGSAAIASTGVQAEGNGESIVFLGCDAAIDNSGGVRSIFIGGSGNEVTDDGAGVTTRATLIGGVNLFLSGANNLVALGGNGCFVKKLQGDSDCDDSAVVAGSNNAVYDSEAAVAAAGHGNALNRYNNFSAIIGGASNTISALTSTLGLDGSSNGMLAGSTNQITGTLSVILGGYDGEVKGTLPTDERLCSAILGGKGNTVNGTCSVAAGGSDATVTGDNSVILGGDGVSSLTGDSSALVACSQAGISADHTVAAGVKDAYVENDCDYLFFAAVDGPTVYTTTKSAFVGGASNSSANTDNGVILGGVSNAFNGTSGDRIQNSAVVGGTSASITASNAAAFVADSVNVDHEGTVVLGGRNGDSFMEGLVLTPNSDGTAFVQSFRGTGVASLAAGVASGTIGDAKFGTQSGDAGFHVRPGSVVQMDVRATISEDDSSGSGEYSVFHKTVIVDNRESGAGTLTTNDAEADVAPASPQFLLDIAFAAATNVLSFKVRYYNTGGNSANKAALCVTVDGNETRFQQS